MCRTQEQFEKFIDTLMNNKLASLEVCAFVYCIGMFYKSVLDSNIYKIPFEIVLDTLPEFLKEVVKLLKDPEYIGMTAFKDFIGEYDEEEMRRFRVAFWTWIYKLRDMMSNVQTLVDSTTEILYAEQYKAIFKTLDIEEQELKEHIKLLGYSDDYALQVSAIFGQVNKNLANLIFVEQKDVLKEPLTIHDRIDGAYAQRLLNRINRNCTYTNP